MEFVRYEPEVDDDRQTREYIQRLLSTDEDAPPLSSGAVVVLHLDESEREAVTRLDAAGKRVGSHKPNDMDDDLVRVHVEYSTATPPFDFAHDVVAQRCVAEIERQVRCVPLHVSRELCRQLLTNDLLEIPAQTDTLAEATRLLAGMAASYAPTHVASIQARGWLFGPLVARYLGLSFIPVLKAIRTNDASDFEEVDCEPIGHGRGVRLLLRPDHVRGRRVILVDDWLESGAQALGVRTLIERCDGEWLGAVTLCDGPCEPNVRDRIGPVVSLYTKPATDSSS